MLPTIDLTATSPRTKGRSGNSKRGLRPGHMILFTCSCICPSFSTSQIIVLWNLIQITETTQTEGMEVYWLVWIYFGPDQYYIQQEKRIKYPLAKQFTVYTLHIIIYSDLISCVICSEMIHNKTYILIPLHRQVCEYIQLLVAAKGSPPKFVFLVRGCWSRLLSMSHSSQSSQCLFVCVKLCCFQNYST